MSAALPNTTRLLNRRVLVRSKDDEALFLNTYGPIGETVDDQLQWGSRECAHDYYIGLPLAFRRAKEKEGVVVEEVTLERALLPPEES